MSHDRGTAAPELAGSRHRPRGPNVLVALLKAVAYSRAPRLTFTLLHPKQAAQLKKLPFDLRTAYAPRIAAVVAAAVALPVGFVLGRRFEQARESAGPYTPRRVRASAPVPHRRETPRDALGSRSRAAIAPAPVPPYALASHPGQGAHTS